MLDGRVLGASQVEYKPFGKPPLKREQRWFTQGLGVVPASNSDASLENEARHLNRPRRAGSGGPCVWQQCMLNPPVRDSREIHRRGRCSKQSPSKVAWQQESSPGRNVPASKGACWHWRFCGTVRKAAGASFGLFHVWFDGAGMLDASAGSLLLRTHVQTGSCLICRSLSGTCNKWAAIFEQPPSSMAWLEPENFQCLKNFHGHLARANMA